MKSCILAVAVGKAALVINSIPGLSFRPPGHPYCHPHLLYERDGVQLNLLVMPLRQNVALPWQSASTSGKWDLFMLVADPGSVGTEAVDNDGGWRWITRAFRKLRRVSASHPTYLRGPWSIAQLVEAYPDKVATLLKGVVDEQGELQPGTEWSFPLLAGSSHDGAVGWDYRPTQEEIDDDTDGNAPEP